MLCVFIDVLPWEDTPETKGNIFFIYIYMEREIKAERKQREGEIQRQIWREGKDYIILLQPCNTLQRIYVT